MVQSCLDTKADTLNYSYADKRALYLAVLAKALTKSKLFSEVQLAGLRGEVSRPILLARPGVYMCLLLAQPCASRGAQPHCFSHASVGKAKKFTLRLRPCIAEDCFPYARLSITRNNVRRSATSLVPQASPENVMERQPATPHYNASILEDMYMQQQLRCYHEVST